MKLPVKIVWIIIAVLIGFALLQLNFTSDEFKENIEEPKEAVVDKAFHTDDLSTFVAAIKTAKLEEILSSETPITIFAPSDKAFSSLPDGKFAELMQSSNKEKLKNIVTYHVVPGRVKASDLKDGQELETIHGDKIKISLSDDKTMVNNTQLVKADIQATNGIIHIIDRVMSPYAAKNKIAKKGQ